ncbi:MAG: YebC/PmpR family DNA-binding transcriptional regulator [Legionellaceae bacterium]|nr:YebC/PmpR family DNA-binding transcriptional regulator [Legionellaceae bacterium]HCA88779.1 YebC/PmpR family DNA-binding transcriptional regulator [Legionellales bacterium]|tara:strand:+ start:687 stop:1424 length:738 start_codon:yes stop_codon:yes gene_type:complete
MAGHSKWANIKFRKGAQDAKRGKIFTKLIREITVSSRLGGGDESTNPRLRDAVIKALKANMKRDTIDNAIKRGAGNTDADNMVSMRYEGYGPQGVAILVDCLSDNKNRTVSDVRHAFTKCQGNLGTDGSVAYLFTHQGEITFKNFDDKVMDVAIDAGAQDFVEDHNQLIIITTAESYHSVIHALEAAGYKPDETELTMRAQNNINVDVENATTLIKLIDMLEDLDDVQEVHTNALFSDEVLTALE